MKKLFSKWSINVTIFGCVESGTLQDYLVNKKFMIGERLIARISYQLADVLKYLHKYGIIHRDLKPANIMLATKLIAKESDQIKNSTNQSSEKDMSVKIMDFGLSKILGKKEKTSEECGTFAFLAPEIILAKPYNNSVDIWSLGINIYYMISGLIPFKEKDITEDDFAIAICNEELRFSKAFDDIDVRAKDLISKCLIKDDNTRISIDEVVDHDWFNHLGIKD